MLLNDTILNACRRSILYSSRLGKTKFSFGSHVLRNKYFLLGNELRGREKTNMLQTPVEILSLSLSLSQQT